MQLPKCFQGQGWERRKIPDFRVHNASPGETWWRHANGDLLTYNYHGKKEWEMELADAKVGGLKWFAEFTPDALHTRYITGKLTGDWGTNPTSPELKGLTIS